MISKTLTKNRMAVSGSRVLLLSSLLLLGACSSSDDDNDIPAQDDSTTTPDEEDTMTPTVPEEVTDSFSAFVASRSADFESGRIDRLSINGDSITVSGSYPATVSDIQVRTDGTDVYQLGRFMTDSLTRFDAEDTSVVDYQFSVNGDDIAANPYDLAFVSDTKAYLTRYGSTAAWIIDPSATTEDEFKTGELDLSAYDADVPNMSDALIVGDRLFILMERLTGFVPNKPGYIAVFDTSTNEEVDTGQGADGLMGIALETVNPTSLQFNEQTGEIYVVGRGNFFESQEVTGDFYSGGLETVDPESFENSLLIDDGTSEANEGGYFVDALVISPSKGYLITYAAFGVNSLRSFNPVTGLLDAETVGGFENQDLGGLSLGPNGNVWISLGGDTPGFARLNPEDDSVAEENVRTELVPTSVVFLPQGAQ